MKKKTVKSIVTAAVVVPVVLIGAAGLSCKLNVVRYELETDKLTNSIRIVLISDLHGSMFGDDQADLINAVKEQKPDLLIYSGDILVDNMPNISPVMLLSGLKGLCPAYAVAGNHEMRTGNKALCKNLFSDYGVVMLEGNSKIITVNNQIIDICGLEDPMIGSEEFAEQLRYFTNRKSEHYSMLISHHAELVESYKKMDFDLVLSGHAHGGQWRIPGLLNGLYAPEQGFFPKYAGGVYTYNNTTQVVSRGLVKFYMLPRFFNPPELVVVDIVPK
jgi:uncharacterized protein